METSRAVVEHAGGAWDASLNFYESSGFGYVATLQIDEFVFVVGSSHFGVTRFTLADWLARDASAAPVMECDTAEQAWEVLRLVREDCLLWQCGGCDAWMFTSNRPRIGVLQCSTCGDGGVDFRHADRNVGGPP